MPTQWINYENKKIIYGDYSNLTGDDMLPVLYKIEEEAKKSNEKMLLLLNFTNTFTNEKFMNEVKRIGKETTEKMTLKTAIVGIEGIKKILLKAYNLFSGAGPTQKLFDTVDEAKKWLVE